MKLERDYIIPFVGLKIGVHNFEYEVSDSFFESFEYSIVQKGNVAVRLTLDKKESMMIGEFTIQGEVELECDRCTDPLMVEVQGDYRLVYKFGNEPSDDESLVIIYPEEFELDLRDNMLELITVSLPTRNVHPEGECNDEMTSLLEEYVLVAQNEELQSEEDSMQDIEGDELDPRWKALKELKNKDK